MPDQRTDPINDRRRAWRHLLQCVLAEQAARVAWTTAKPPKRRAAEKRLVAEGLRLDAAIDALDDTLTTENRRPA